MKASGDRHLSRRERALARPSSRGGRTAASAPVGPSRALGPCVSPGNSWGERPQLAPARSLLRCGNGRAGRNLHARRCVDCATHLHDAVPPAQAESSTMRWRKKLYDALTVRTQLFQAVPSSALGRPRGPAVGLAWGARGDRFSACLPALRGGGSEEPFSLTIPRGLRRLGAGLGAVPRSAAGTGRARPV